MQSREREFGFLLFQAIGPGGGIHPQAPLQDQPLAHLNPVLKILGKVAETHHLELTRRVFRAKTIHPHLHLSDGHLVVLGVSDRWCLEHFHLKQAVIHVRCAAGAPMLPHTRWSGQPHG